MLLVCSLIFLTALIRAGAPVASRALAVDAQIAVTIVLAALLVCALAGGMAGVTATQVAQYAVLLIGSLAVFFIYAAQPIAGCFRRKRSRNGGFWSCELS